MSIILIIVQNVLSFKKHVYFTVGMSLVKGALHEIKTIHIPYYIPTCTTAYNKRVFHSWNVIGYRWDPLN